MIPEGWEFVPIDFLLVPLEDGRTIHQGWSPQCEKESSPNSEVWGVLKTTAIQPGRFLPEHNKRLPDSLTPRPLLEVKRGDVVVTSAGPRGRCGVACLVRNSRPRLMLSGKMYRFRIDERLADPRFIEAYLLSDRALTAIDGMKTGISDSGLNLTQSRFRKLMIPLPPRELQGAIVEEIEKQFTRLEVGTEALARAKRKASRLRRQIRASASVGRLGNEETWDATRDSRGFPPGWEVTRLEDLCLPKIGLITGPFGSLLKKSDHRDIGIPVVGIPNITAAGFKPGKWFYVDPEKAEQLKRYSVRAGDLLVSRSGTVGEVCVMPAEPSGAIMSTNLMRIRLIDTSLSSWVALSIQGSPIIHDQLSRLLGGSTRDFLNLTILSQLLIGIPPLHERERLEMEIDERLSQLAAVVEATDTAMRRGQVLARAVLRSTFRAELQAGVRT